MNGPQGYYPPFASALLFVLLLGCGGGADHTSYDDWKHKKVFLKESVQTEGGAPLDALVVVQPLEILEVRGPWLKTRVGWLRGGDLLPDAQAALQYYESRMQATPTAAGLATLGAARMELKQVEQASKDFSRAVELDPTFALAYYYRATNSTGSEPPIADINRAIELSPRFSAAYLMRAVVRQHQDDWQGALADSNEAVRLDPTEPLAWGARGNAHSRLGDQEKAISDLGQAVKLDPNLSAAHRYLGDAWDRAGDKQKALASYSRALELNAVDRFALRSRAEIRFALKDFDAAAEDLTVLITQQPDDADNLFGRGMAFEEGGKHAAAEKDFTEVLRLDPALATAWRWRGDARRKQGNLVGALEDYTEAIRREPESVDLHVLRGQVLFDQGEFGLAETAYDDALRLQPGHSVAVVSRGAARQHLGKHDEALADFNTGIQAEPKNAAFLRHRAELLLQRGANEQAMADLALALSLDSRPSAYSHRAQAWLKLREFRKAVDDATQAIKASPLESSYYNVRAIAYSRMDKVREAIADWTRAIELAPQEPTYFVNRGRGHWLIGKYDLALQDVTEGLRHHPKDAEAIAIRAQIWLAKEQFEKAEADARMSLDIDRGQAEPHLVLAEVHHRQKEYSVQEQSLLAAQEAAKPDDLPVLEAIAWFRATCPDRQRRNGKQAVEVARRLCELTGWERANPIAILATAHAENGEFPEAVVRIKEALAKNTDESFADEYRGRLKLFESGKAYPLQGSPLRSP